MAVSYTSILQGQQTTDLWAQDVLHHCQKNSLRPDLMTSVWRATHSQKFILDGLQSKVQSTKQLPLQQREVHDSYHKNAWNAFREY